MLKQEFWQLKNWQNSTSFLYFNAGNKFKDIEWLAWAWHSSDFLAGSKLVNIAMNDLFCSKHTPGIVKKGNTRADSLIFRVGKSWCRDRPHTVVSLCFYYSCVAIRDKIEKQLTVKRIISAAKSRTGKRECVLQLMHLNGAHTNLHIDSYYPLYSTNRAIS